MKKFKVLLLAIICMLQTTWAGVDANATPKKILPYPILQHKMANGLNVVTVPYDSPGLAAFYIVVRVGSRDEIEETHGLTERFTT